MQIFAVESSEVENGMLYLNIEHGLPRYPIVYNWRIWFYKNVHEKIYFEQKKYKTRGYLVVWHSILIGRWLNIFRLLGKWIKKMYKEHIFFSKWSDHIKCFFQLYTNHNYFNGILNNLYACSAQFENLAWSIVIFAKKKNKQKLTLPILKPIAVHVAC